MKQVEYRQLEKIVERAVLSALKTFLEEKLSPSFSTEVRRHKDGSLKGLYINGRRID